MTFEEAKKKYERFLKEMGVYRRVIEIHSTSHNYLKEIGYPNYIQRNKLCPSTWLQSVGAFCSWVETPEKDIFWWAISLLWECHCYENKIFLDNIRHDGFDNKWLYNNLKRYIDYYSIAGVIKEASSIDIKTLDKLKNEILEKYKKYSIKHYNEK